LKSDQESRRQRKKLSMRAIASWFENTLIAIIDDSQPSLVGRILNITWKLWILERGG
jgi:hypothetical protein